MSNKYKKKSFLFYEDWKLAAEELSADERLLFYEAVMNYAFTGVLPDALPVGLKAMFRMAKPFIDSDKEKWEEKKKQRSEAGKLGGAPKGNSNASKQKQAKQAKQADNVSVSVSENVSVNENVNVSENENVTKKGLSRTSFTPPTQEEVARYIEEKGYAFSAEAFCDFYESKGWMVGRNKMKDWRAAVRNWQRGEQEKNGMTINNNSNYGSISKPDKAARAADTAAVIARIRSKERGVDCQIWR